MTPHRCRIGVVHLSARSPVFAVSDSGPVPISCPCTEAKQTMNDDMKVNRSLILSLRKQRSWSQDELAVAAGLNLRTVQRIERSGSASLQSKKSLAAAFGIEVSDLESPEKSMTSKYEYRVVRVDMKWSGRGIVETDVAAIENDMS